MATTPKEQQKKKGPQRREGAEGLRAWDGNPTEYPSVLASNYFRQHSNGGITAKMITTEVLAVTPEEWGRKIDSYLDATGAPPKSIRSVDRLK